MQAVEGKKLSLGEILGEKEEYVQNTGVKNGGCAQLLQHAAKMRFMSGIITQQGKTGYNMKYMEIKTVQNSGF